MPETDATQPSSQPAADLERGLDRGPYSLPSPLTADELEQLEIAWFQGQEPEWWLTNIPPGDLGSTYAIARLVTTIRATLRERRELREALERIENLAGWNAGSEAMDARRQLIRIRDVARKALLAQPAAGEERERG